jgi:hypothetical protein
MRARLAINHFIFHGLILEHDRLFDCMRRFAVRAGQIYAKCVTLDGWHRVMCAD